MSAELSTTRSALEARIAELRARVEARAAPPASPPAVAAAPRAGRRRAAALRRKAAGGVLGFMLADGGIEAPTQHGPAAADGAVTEPDGGVEVPTQPVTDVAVEGPTEPVTDGGVEAPTQVITAPTPGILEGGVEAPTQAINGGVDAPTQVITGAPPRLAVGPARPLEFTPPRPATSSVAVPLPGGEALPAAPAMVATPPARTRPADSNSGTPRPRPSCLLPPRKAQRVRKPRAKHTARAQLQAAEQSAASASSAGHGAAATAASSCSDQGPGEDSEVQRR